MASAVFALPVAEIRPDADVHAVRHTRSRLLLGGGIARRKTTLAGGAPQTGFVAALSLSLRRADHDCRVF